MRLGLIRGSHHHNGIAKRVANCNLAPLMLIGVKPIELLEFVVDVGRHDQADIPVRWPVGCLEALNAEVKVGVDA